MLTDRALSELEERLRQAMLASDIAALDALIADDLIFTTETGAVIGKAADLEAHRSGLLRFSALDPAERHAVTAGGVAVLMMVSGAYGGEPFSGSYRYTRVWGEVGGRWRVVAGHMSEAGAARGAT